MVGGDGVLSRHPHPSSGVPTPAGLAAELHTRTDHTLLVFLSRPLSCLRFVFLLDWQDAARGRSHPREAGCFGTLDAQEAITVCSSIPAQGTGR